MTLCQELVETLRFTKQNYYSLLQKEMPGDEQWYQATSISSTFDSADHWTRLNNITWHAQFIEGHLIKRLSIKIMAKSH
jgi:hypothetical protein